MRDEVFFGLLTLELLLVTCPTIFCLAGVQGATDLRKFMKSLRSKWTYFVVVNFHGPFEFAQGPRITAYRKEVDKRARLNLERYKEKVV